MRSIGRGERVYEIHPCNSPSTLRSLRPAFGSSKSLIHTIHGIHLTGILSTPTMQSTWMYLVNLWAPAFNLDVISLYVAKLIFATYKLSFCRLIVFFVANEDKMLKFRIIKQ